MKQSHFWEWEWGHERKWVHECAYVHSSGVMAALLSSVITSGCAFFFSVVLALFSTKCVPLHWHRLMHWVCFSGAVPHHCPLTPAPSFIPDTSVTVGASPLPQLYRHRRAMRDRERERELLFQREAEHLCLRQPIHGQATDRHT